MFPSQPWYMPPVPSPKPPPEFDAEIEDEHDRVREWRLAHLEALGIPYPMALELALVGVDWHRVERAIKQGMTVEQVGRVFL